MSKAKNIKFKATPTMEKMVIKLPVTDKERLDFLNAFNQGPVKIQMEGRDYKVIKHHPLAPTDKGIIKLTVK